MFCVSALVLLTFVISSVWKHSPTLNCFPLDTHTNTHLGTPESKRPLLPCQLWMEQKHTGCSIKCQIHRKRDPSDILHCALNSFHWIQSLILWFDNQSTEAYSTAVKRCIFSCLHRNRSAVLHLWHIHSSPLLQWVRFLVSTLSTSEWLPPLSLSHIESSRTVPHAETFTNPANVKPEIHRCSHIWMWTTFTITHTHIHAFNVWHVGVISICTKMIGHTGVHVGVYNINVHVHYV